MSKDPKPTPPSSGGGNVSACSISSNCPVECPTKVVFKEKSSEADNNYGFDDYTNSTIPWKSVEKGKVDKVDTKITPSGKFANLAYESSAVAKVTVSPAKAASATQEIKVKGVAKGESTIKGSCDGSILGKMKVKTYTKLTKTVAVRLVHEKNYNSTDVSDADIKAYLKKVFKQAVVEFTMIRLAAKTVEFDKNNDGKLDVDSWMSDEMKKIRDECKDDSYDYNIFLVDKPSDGSLGFMDFNQRYGYVHLDNSSHPGNTICHELGHGAFSLVHPDQKTPADNDKKNLMHSDEPSPWRLRRNQLDKINP